MMGFAWKDYLKILGIAAVLFFVAIAVARGWIWVLVGIACLVCAAVFYMADSLNP